MSDDKQTITVNKSMALAVIVAVAVGFFVGGGHVHNPFNPTPNRPVINFLSKVARLGLWMMFLADGRQQQDEHNYAAHKHTVYHREGW